ncbi:MAG TPA: hypothetical protein VGP55_10465 [Chitinophagaceae bacterium]|nr:hypothetical protein [Chitinophagaceae bacterium]
MKKLFTALLILLMTKAFSQNVGIGISTPLAKLHVNSADSGVAIFQNTQTLGVDINAGLYYKTESYYTGAIKTIGTSTNTARLGFYTSAAASPLALFERVSILDNGYVGINTTKPSAQLDVNGQVKISGGNPAAGKVLTTNSATGLATWENPPSTPSGGTGFSVLASSSSTIANSFSATVPFNNTINAYGFDDGSNFNNNSHGYVAPATGVYQFNFTISLLAGTSTGTGIVFAFISRNGFNYNTPALTISTIAGQPFPHSASLSFLMKLDAGDVATVIVQNSSNGTVTISNNIETQFSGVRVY